MRSADESASVVLVAEDDPDIRELVVVERLKASGATSSLRVILLTARAQEVDVQRGLAAGADDCVTKPFGPRKFRERVQAVLDCR